MSLQGYTPESVLPYLIHLIAHHPDFSPSVDDIRDAQKYLDFFVSLLTEKSDCFPFLKAIAESAKQHVDALAMDKSGVSWCMVSDNLVSPSCPRLR